MTAYLNNKAVTMTDKVLINGREWTKRELHFLVENYGDKVPKERKGKK